MVNIRANPYGTALWHEWLHYNSAGTNSSLQDCNNPVATGSLPSSMHLSLPPHKPKIARKHHPRLVADLGLCCWFVSVHVCVRVCHKVTAIVLLSCGNRAGTPASCLSLLSTSIVISRSYKRMHFLSFSLPRCHPALFTQTMKPKENVLMSRIAFSCVSKRNHEHCFVSELLHRGEKKRCE